MLLLSKPRSMATKEEGLAMPKKKLPTLRTAQLRRSRGNRRVLAKILKLRPYPKR